MRRLMTMFVALLCLLCGLGQPANASEAAGKIKVVATLSVFGDLVKQIGGEYVDVHTVASPRFNPHFIEPKPKDVLRVSKADLFVHAGLDLESAWSDPLLQAAGNQGVLPGNRGNLDLSPGIKMLDIPEEISRAHGDIHVHGNPHYWLDPRNGLIMAKTIADRLSAMDPEHGEVYQQNFSAFRSALEDKIRAWKSRLPAVHGKEAVAYHDCLPYLADFCGISIEQFLEPKPGIPPAPRHIAFVEKYMQEHGIRVMIQQTFYSKDVARAMEKRTGAKLYLVCENVGETAETPDYIALCDYNIRTIMNAFSEK